MTTLPYYIVNTATYFNLTYFAGSAGAGPLKYFGGIRILAADWSKLKSEPQLIQQLQQNTNNSNNDSNDTTTQLGTISEGNVTGVGRQYRRNPNKC